MSAESHEYRIRVLTHRCRALAVLTMAITLWTLVANQGNTSVPSKKSFLLQVDPNSAPEGVLEALPRIGPVMASRIIEGRLESPFLNADDLGRRIRGVGPITLDGMRSLLRFDTRVAEPATSPDR